MNSKSASIGQRLTAIRESLPESVTLVTVSKTKTIADIEAAMQTGQLDFGENRVQELTDKALALPGLQWHQIGHLQTNKVKKIIPFVHLIHAADSERVIDEIDRRAADAGRVIDILLQVHIAQETQKFGWEPKALKHWLHQQEENRYENVRFRGLMGMASFTDDTKQIAREFRALRSLFESWKFDNSWDTLSMGMSGDWKIAVEEGSTMIRVGSSIFGSR